MNASVTTATLTTEELFALPEDGIERDLIRGELREYPSTLRTRLNAASLMAVCNTLNNWARTSDGPGGEVAIGNVGVRLTRNPETMVGVDVAYFSPESIALMPPNQPWYEGPPVLAVEILSPSDTHEDLVAKINLYLECSVQVVWILDPDFETLTIYRANEAPVMLRKHETLNGHPELPNLNVLVKDFFV